MHWNNKIKINVMDVLCKLRQSLPSFRMNSKLRAFFFPAAAILVLTVFLMFRQKKIISLSDRAGQQKTILPLPDKAALHPSMMIVGVDIQFSPETIDFPCPVVSHEGRAFPVCVYTEADDQTISTFMLRNKYWEAEFVSKTLRLVNMDSDIEFVDIGSNVGAYTLSAAHSGVKVIAVEPNVETMRRLAASIQLGNISNRVTLLNNAVSNEHKFLALMTLVSNRGATFVQKNNTCTNLPEGYKCLTNAKTILLDDLVPLLKGKKVVIKSDAQGSEVNMFCETGASAFFSVVKVVAVMMEWDNFKPQYLRVPDEDVKNMLKFFHNLGFFGHSMNLDRLPDDWKTWPDNVLFLK